MLRTTDIALLLASLVAGVGCCVGSVPRVNTRGGGSNPPDEPNSLRMRDRSSGSFFSHQG